jgi:Zn-dependent protease with chaperone function
MHLVDLALPLVVLLVAVVTAAVASRLVRPPVAALSLVLVLGAAGLALLWSSAGVAVAWASQTARHHGPLGWCAHLYASHDHVPTWLGALTMGWLFVAGVRVAGVVRWHRSLRTPPGRSLRPAIDVIQDGRPSGFALPGRPGRVVVTTGLLEALDEGEQQALLAHEHAHLALDHYRYLLVADLAGAVAPVLIPLRSRLRFVLERWADETACVGLGDRMVVARAIARAALAGADVGSVGGLAASGLGVPARVEALLMPAGRSSRRALPVGAGAVLVVVAAAALQLHHIAAFVQHGC